MGFLSTPGFLSPDAYYAIPRNPRNIVFARHNRLISQHIIHYITSSSYKKGSHDPVLQHRGSRDPITKHIAEAK